MQFFSVAILETLGQVCLDVWLGNVILIPKFQFLAHVGEYSLRCAVELVCLSAEAILFKI